MWKDGGKKGFLLVGFVYSILDLQGYSSLILFDPFVPELCASSIQLSKYILDMPR